MNPKTKERLLLRKPKRNARSGTRRRGRRRRIRQRKVRWTLSLARDRRRLFSSLRRDSCDSAPGRNDTDGWVDPSTGGPILESLARLTSVTQPALRLAESEPRLGLG